MVSGTCTVRTIALASNSSVSRSPFLCHFTAMLVCVCTLIPTLAEHYHRFGNQHKRCSRRSPVEACLWGRRSRRVHTLVVGHTAGRAPDRCCRNLDRPRPNQRIRGRLYRQCRNLKHFQGLLETDLPIWSGTSPEGF